MAISKTFPTEGCLSPVVEKKKKTFCSSQVWWEMGVTVRQRWRKALGNGKVIRWRVSWVRMDGECWGNGFTLGRRLCLEFLNIIKGKHSPIGANRKEDKGVVMGSYDQLRIGRQKKRR